ncbi:hypothetical protein [Klebsiella aerogenes EA1509E]|nr:hypothetical protein [Klebsiella aerogenes EA1509E]
MPTRTATIDATNAPAEYTIPLSKESCVIVGIMLASPISIEAVGL